jgi:hypothetical protein
MPLNLDCFCGTTVTTFVSGFFLVSTATGAEDEQTPPEQLDLERSPIAPTDSEPKAIDVAKNKSNISLPPKESHKLIW